MPHNTCSKYSYILHIHTPFLVLFFLLLDSIITYIFRKDCNLGYNLNKEMGRMNQVNIREIVSKESNLYSVIEKIGTLQHYKKNEIIYLQDDSVHTFYLLKSGRVRQFFTSVNGNELTVKILGVNNIFGE